MVDLNSTIAMVSLIVYKLNRDSQNGKNRDPVSRDVV